MTTWQIRERKTNKIVAEFCDGTYSIGYGMKIYVAAKSSNMVAGRFSHEDYYSWRKGDEALVSEEELESLKTAVEAKTSCLGQWSIAENEKKFIQKENDELQSRIAELGAKKEQEESRAAQRIAELNFEKAEMRADVRKASFCRLLEIDKELSSLHAIEKKQEPEPKEGCNRNSDEALDKDLNVYGDQQTKAPKFPPLDMSTLGNNVKVPLEPEVTLGDEVVDLVNRISECKARKAIIESSKNASAPELHELRNELRNELRIFGERLVTLINSVKG